MLNNINLETEIIPRKRPVFFFLKTKNMKKKRTSEREEQPHVQGAVAAQAQEGLEELLHVQGQEGQLWGDTPRPR